MKTLSIKNIVLDHGENTVVLATLRAVHRGKIVRSQATCAAANTPLPAGGAILLQRAREKGTDFRELRNRSRAVPRKNTYRPDDIARCHAPEPPLAPK
ncbi:hypothetical protein [Novosphingobium album (ex Liu et al. 2023)]|uniref:Uncharacterized protein n=1 Tax=Novosphingobium album (ex Liu et al. 2023) TaxID=3031130 RepID=A0ABT5WXC8_9SPHN|nr:hypothetical protein [Novosphingobium album (ex Liu et al. 2023)]MDE8654551.1 hypothetical protein [Novosphingobium album (ex Liu et al. 2023)]